MMTRTIVFLLSFFSVVNAEFLGPLPSKISWHIKYLKNTTETNSLRRSFKNRLLLYGPPGNGKTTLVKKIAEDANAILLSVAGPAIVQRFIGDGANNIRTLFNDALRLQGEKKVPIIIFIDEIDAIATYNISEQRTEHQAALQQLWLELDDIKSNQHILFICATNRFEHLNNVFLDRFGGNIIEFKNPDAEKRKDLLLHYFAQQDITLANELLEKLVSQTEGLSIRALEDLACDSMIAHEIDAKTEIDEQLIWKEFAIIRKKVDENIGQEPKKTFFDTLQKINTVTTTVHSVLSIASIVCSFYMMKYSQQS